MKEHEPALALAILRHLAVESNAFHPVPMRDIISALPFPAKQLWRVIEKWERKDWLQCGTSSAFCWLTDAGAEALESLSANPTST